MVITTAPRGRLLRVGELAARTGTTADTVRYYERLGLVAPAARSDAGYRLYGPAELDRLNFVRRARLLGLTLGEIRGLLGLADEGDCHPLRQQVAELLRRRIAACDAQLAEIQALKAALEERYRLALVQQDAPACDCAGLRDGCGCLPVRVDELATPGRRVARR